jgi:hypothetical protein
MFSSYCFVHDDIRPVASVWMTKTPAILHSYGQMQFMTQAAFPSKLNSRVAISMRSMRSHP